jgi:hypothetical protein
MQKKLPAMRTALIYSVNRVVRIKTELTFFNGILLPDDLQGFGFAVAIHETDQVQTFAE